MAGPYYNINKNSETHQMSPSWVVQFVPYTDPTVQDSFNKDITSRVTTRQPITVVNDSTSITVSSSKNSYSDSVTVNLKAGEIDYSRAVNVGDHMFVWITRWQEHADAIFSKLQSGQSVNSFNSGLKFAGKVTSVNKSTAVDVPGTPDVTIIITGQMFTELGSSVYVNSSSLDSVSSNQKLAKQLLFSRLNPQNWKIFQDQAPGRIWRTPDELSIFLLSTFLGAGPDDALKYLADPNKSKALLQSYNSTMTYPAKAAQIFGVNRDSTFFEIMNLYTGVEKYKAGSIAANHSLYLPSSVPPVTDNAAATIRQSPKLKGSFVIISPDWSNVQLYNLVSQWVHPVSNELYTSLKFDPYNGIRPAIIHRQIPFTTPNLNELGAKAISAIKVDKGSQQLAKESGVNDYLTAVTEYSNIPRWRIGTELITSINIAASSEGRINFVQVFDYSADTAQQYANIHNETGSIYNATDILRAAQIEDGNFIFDEADIKKHGVKAAIMNSQIAQTVLAPAIAPFMAAIQADFQFNSHLKFTGKVTIAGIQEPIAIGDNAEIDGILYHIEGLAHTARIAPNGQKIFRTTLTLSHGIVASSLETNTVVYPGQVQSGYFGKTDIQYTNHTNRDDEGFLI